MRSYAVTKRELEKLKPYLAGENPREDNGEWDMFCPLHGDTNRSASLNVYERVWRCFACDDGGPVGLLLDRSDEWVPREYDARANGNGYRSRGPEELPSEGTVEGWHDTLMSNVDGSLGRLQDRRGLGPSVAQTYQLGWDMYKQAFTIPVRDKNGNLVNVRRYQTDPPPDRRKIWGVSGHNETRLYPLDQLGSDWLILCEGELDALMLIQHGFPAMTKTGSAKAWMRSWNRYFKGKVLYLCHDMDIDGQLANQKIGAHLDPMAKEIRIIRLPYAVTKKNGRDVTDWWIEHGDAEDWRRLMDEAVLLGDPALPDEEKLEEVSRPIDAMDSKRARRPIRMTLTIEGKVTPGYTVPRKVKFTCGMDAGAMCKNCPMMEKDGQDVFDVGAGEIILEMVDNPSHHARAAIKAEYGIRCKSHYLMQVLEEQAVETLIGRAPIDTPEENDFTSIRIRHVGGHDTPSNETVQVVGALYPNPKSHTNEFVASEVLPVETSLDRFEPDGDTLDLLTRFQPTGSETPLRKLVRIASDLETHVTHIYGRRELHMAMDLVWHSPIAFNFDGQLVERGWLELLVVGDTRTGKSEAAQRILRWYRAGELVSCETASLAGVLGGVHQPTGQQWALTWGKIPLNDRRLVVLDEIGGLTHEEISSLSHLRSSGIAELAKIKAGRTRARCRSIWLGNPREGKMQDYTFGIDALEPMIGKPEDIARFDLAMTVAMGEVASDVMNRPSNINGQPRYHSDACHQLIRWAWSRKPEQIVWHSGVEAYIYEQARDMGNRYMEHPPLVQAANVRVKIARVAIALAMRTFSTDRSCEQVVVTRRHVRDAIRFMDHIYAMPGFGYHQRSLEEFQNQRNAQGNLEDVRRYLHENPELLRFLKGRGSGQWFKRWDFESFLNLPKDLANATINKLWDWGMLEGTSGDVKLSAALRKLLRTM